ncbi:MAG: glucuronate isomerase [Acutalibacteraceae bacterium]|nr:glucuronate isomerase [Oscillospiraceae bacterium]
MKDFIGEDFLLETEEAKQIYNDFAKDMPICDYHCHLSPKEIYENKSPKNITELWLSGDHYKWRIMRACGIDEEFITGSGEDKEKFVKFACSLQYAIGNPLYHWAHLELKKYFGITTPLNIKTAGEIYEKANEKILCGDFRPQTLIQKSNVKYICTTDDPTDSLEYHLLLHKEDISFKVYPTFRPDRALDIDKADFPQYIKKLSDVCGAEINDIDALVGALYSRADFFSSVGCRVSDHSFGVVPFIPADKNVCNSIFTKALSGALPSFEEVQAYKTYVFTALCKKYKELDWCCEIHIGALRNNNTSMFNKVGPDSGFDSMNDKEVAQPLSGLLDSLNTAGILPKCVLFNLNSKDNLVLAATTGNFQSSDAECKIQFGPAWWYLDTIDGMTAQMKTLASVGVLGKFIGMETDSRSFTSYARHDYFRRILCSVVGDWINRGMISDDKDIIKEIIEGICYNNAVKYFNF